MQFNAWYSFTTWPDMILVSSNVLNISDKENYAIDLVLTSRKCKVRGFPFCPIIAMVKSHVLTFPGVVVLEAIAAAVIGTTIIVAVVGK